MNVSDEDFYKMKSAIVASLKESIQATRTFELRENQIIEFVIQHSIFRKNIRAQFYLFFVLMEASPKKR